MHRAPLLVSLILFASCGARWQVLDPHDPYAEVNLEPSQRQARETHGHRDFARLFTPVWAATVQALHADGVAVPESAREAARHSRTEVMVELEGLWLQVVEREPGRTCVLLRFRELDPEAGRRAAKALLDEIQMRL
jgi:hypothetical protein